NQRHETMVRDVNWAHQSMRLRMLAARDRLSAMAREQSKSEASESQFLNNARELVVEHPEIIHLAWLNAERQAPWHSTAPSRVGQSFRMSLPADLPDLSAFGAYETARIERRPAYSRPYQGQFNEIYFDLYMPVYNNEVFVGALAAVYSVDGLINHLI